jgi:hypothetical protein
MGDLVPLALSIAPELARWLSGDGAEEIKVAIAKAVQGATGTTDPAAGGAMLQQNPGAQAQLRVQLAQLAAGQESAARAAELDAIAASAAPKTSTAWSAPIISAVVLLTFASVMILVLTRGVPAGNETVANMLLGTLAAMATAVVSYWVGSSAGSARKDERLAQVTK